VHKYIYIVSALLTGRRPSKYIVDHVHVHLKSLESNNPNRNWSTRKIWRLLKRIWEDFWCIKHRKVSFTLNHWNIIIIFNAQRKQKLKLFHLKKSTIYNTEKHF